MPVDKVVSTSDQRDLNVEQHTPRFSQLVNLAASEGSEKVLCLCVSHWFA